MAASNVNTAEFKEHEQHEDGVKPMIQMNGLAHWRDFLLA